MANCLSVKMNTFAHKARPRVPFTALNTVWRLIDKESKSILDVGCGKGEPMKFINRNQQFHTVGVDIFEPYIDLCKEQQIHDKYLVCDICDLPFAKKSFDTVLCMEVLEHLDKEDGEKLLRDIERIARKQVVLTTPVGNYEQEVFDDNLHQEHKYIWSPCEMKEQGYKTIGIGMRNLGGKSGIQSPLPGFLHPFVNFFWVLAGPVVYFAPGLAGDMVCIKKVG